MNKYNEEIRRYEEEAEDRYDDFDDDDFDGEDSYDEDSYEEVEYVEEGSYEEDSYDNYAPLTNMGRIDPNDRTLTITISNTSGQDAEAIIFGGNENAAQPAGVTVIVQESSHNEVREESKANPFRIVGMKMSVSDALQFDNVWNIIKRSATGKESRSKYQPRNATSPQNQDPKLIDDSSFSMDVTGQDSIRFFQKAGTKTTLTFTISARTNMGNVLDGQNVAEVSNTPRTTGLPQIDMLNQLPVRGLGMGARPMVKRPVNVIRKVVRRPIKAVGASRPAKAVVRTVSKPLPKGRILRKRRP